MQDVCRYYETSTAVWAWSSQGATGLTRPATNKSFICLINYIQKHNGLGS